jgi:hypothetical protein
VIAGGSSWLDSLLLAPGLHYQQAADMLAGSQPNDDDMGAGLPTGPLLTAVETLQDGRATTFAVNNAATRQYIRKIARPGEMVTLDVGSFTRARTGGGRTFRLKRSGSGLHATVWADDAVPNLGWLSHLLYLTSPALTIVAFVFMFLIQDCELYLSSPLRCC